jgi:RNA ligase (TIGR02306 family)
VSSLIVPVTRISQVRPHPAADRLEIADVLGWQVIVPKGRYKDGDRVVFFPPDSVLTPELADRFGATKYLANGRVKCAKLRGEPSYGLVADLDDPSWTEGANVADHYGVTKFVPPVRSEIDAEEEHVLFDRYTSIEDLRNFPNVLQTGEEVVATEKVDGTSSRIGRVRDVDRYMLGSHDMQRKSLPPGSEESIQRVNYALPMDLFGVRNLLETWGSFERNIILFGEIFGPKLGDFNYGRKARDFLAFDLMADSRYLDFDVFKTLMDQYKIPTVPIVYRGPFDMAVLRKLADETSSVGGEKYREGLVVRPVKERKQEFGRDSYAVRRVIFKLKGDKYLTGGHTDFKDV